jgi:hypothetical protein
MSQPLSDISQDLAGMTYERKPATRNAIAARLHETRLRRSEKQ